MIRRHLGELPGDLESRRKEIGGGVQADTGAPASAPGRPGPARGRLRVSAGVLNGVTVAGSKQIAPGLATRDYLEFQNQSLVNDMVLNFGTAAGLKIGIVVPAGQTRIWDTKPIINSLHVFCVAAGQPWAVVEGIEAGSQ